MEKLTGLNKLKTVVFISGTGSNLKNLIKFSKIKNTPISINLIISNTNKAKGLKYADQFNIKKKIFNFQNTKNTEKKETENFIINTINTNYIFIKNSQYGAHYNAAYKIFLAHPYFGIGIKNFRKESGKDKYKNDEYKWTHKRMTTHPHQIHFEFLSETGLFGYVSFLIFILTSLFLSIKNYLKFKNFYQLMAILYILASLIPLVPSGSFFSTYSSILFWINYAIMVSYIKKTKF